MKSHMILAVAALFMVTSSLATKAQAAPPSAANAPGITQGPWTSANPGSSKSQCNPGEYVVGIGPKVRRQAPNAASAAF